MGFTNLIFIFGYFPISIVLALLLLKVRNNRVSSFLLILWSLVFYAFGGIQFLGSLTVLTVIVYLFGLAIDHNRQNRKNCKVMILGVSLLTVLLFYFKYASWLASLLKIESTGFINFSSIVIPLGISFITFEAVSYLVDIYRGTSPGNFLDCALFLLFFPKILSGPIVLWKDFQPQIASRSSSLADINIGLNRVSIGLAKKAILADSFGQLITTINAGIAQGYAGDQGTVWLAAVLYFFQIYFDFSGYSDTAIGLSMMFGFHLKENFNYPYVSKSVSEFWRRWHISLGAWFREYVYFPLGGSRSGNVYINLFIVFLLTGIWHGASWNFVIWGVLNGIMVVLERFVQKHGLFKKIPGWICWLFSMAFIFFSWVIFMTPDLAEALQYYTLMFTGSADGLTFSLEYFLNRRVISLLLIAAVASILGAHQGIRSWWTNHTSASRGLLVKNFLCLLLLAVSIVFIINSSYTPNLYFQF